MSDLIERQAAIDAFERFIHELGIEDEPYNYGEMALSARNVPSVENKGEWNPLNSDEEGMIIGSLPDEGEEVLVTVYGQVEIDSFGCDFICEDYGDEGRLEWFCENNDIEDVKAWMPKPAPYKGKVDNNEKV